MTREEKENIDRLVNIWLTAIQSASNDAGWQGMSLAARLIEYMGEPPGPTGNDQSNLTMINAIRLLREPHGELPKIAAVLKIMQFEVPDQSLALLAKNYYLGLNPSTDKAYTDIDRAELVGQDYREFRYNLEKSYFSMRKELRRAKTYFDCFEGAKSA